MFDEVGREKGRICELDIKGLFSHIASQGLDTDVIYWCELILSEMISPIFKSHTNLPFIAHILDPF